MISDKVPPPPGAAVAALRMALDPYNEPQYGERVPYVIAQGELGSRLVDRAIAPEDMLDSKLVLPSQSLDAVHVVLFAEPARLMECITFLACLSRLSSASLILLGRMSKAGSLTYHDVQQPTMPSVPMP